MRKRYNVIKIPAGIIMLRLLSNQYAIVVYIAFVVAMNCSWMVSITLCACTKSYSSWLVCERGCMHALCVCADKITLASNRTSRRSNAIAK